MYSQTRFQELSLAAKWTIGLFGAVGIAAGLFSLALQPTITPIRVLLLLTVAVLGARSKVNLFRNSSISFLTAVVLLAVISEGPAVAVLVAVFGVTVQTFLPSKRLVLHQWVFNTGMIAMTVLLTWWTYHLLSGALPLATMSAQMTATVFASFVYFLCNSISVSLIVALTEGLSMIEIWSSHFLYSAPSFLIAGMLSLGVIGLAGAYSLTLLAGLISVIGLACRVESGRADRPFHRPLNQTARAVFPQAAFLSCSSFGIRCVAAGGGFVRTAFGSFAKGTIQFHDISAFPIARTFTTEYGDFPLQRAFWTRQRRCSKQRSETLCLPSRS